ncbi:MAG: polysaccharide deacetylase family protein [Peptococcaceae bacterium]|nr:polysaccharide deacetylase family protein [Peptococcaceae bacterium]
MLRRIFIFCYLYVIILALFIGLKPFIGIAQTGEAQIGATQPDASPTSAYREEVKTSDQKPVQDDQTTRIPPYEIKGTSQQLSKKNIQSIAEWKQQVQTFSDQYGNTVYINGQTGEKMVALTFDDGPDGQVTPAILDILKSYGGHASFFFTGQNVKTFPAIVRRAYQEGNLVLNHSYSHPNFDNKKPEFIKDEINKTGQLIETLTGKIPALVRPPYGIVNENIIKIAKDQNFKLIIWSTDTFDWSHKDADHIANNVLQNIRPGEIVLMHSNGDKTQTQKALPKIIEGLHAKGYKIVTLDYLLHVKAYKN